MIALMMTIDLVLHRIRSYAENQKWTVAELARRAGANWSAINGIYDDPGWSPSMKTLRRLEAVVPPDYVAPPIEDSASASTSEVA